MANTLKIQTLVQNTWAATSTKKAVRHGTPFFSATLSGKESVVLELTGTGSHTLVNDGTNFNYNAGTLLTSPINDGDVVEITDNIIYGFALVVKRAVAATAPTGHVRVTNGGFCGWISNGHWKMGEDSVFVFHNPSSPVTSDSTGLTIDLSNGTGFKVSLVAYCK